MIAKTLFKPKSRLAIHIEILKLVPTLVNCSTLMRIQALELVDADHDLVF